MTDHVTPEKARAMATNIAAAGHVSELEVPLRKIWSALDSLAAQLEAAQEVIEAARKVQEGRDLEQPKHFAEFVTLLDAQRDALAALDKEEQ